MHELSIAHSLVGCVREAAVEHGLTKVTQVKIRLGPLAGVVTDALRFAWDIATSHSVCAGSKLVIVEVPITAYCPACAEVITLPTSVRFRCPHCDELTPDIRSGRELELIQISDEPPE